jgi:glutaminyl-tRNA synthetase
MCDLPRVPRSPTARAHRLRQGIWINYFHRPRKYGRPLQPAFDAQTPPRKTRSCGGHREDICWLIEGRPDDIFYGSDYFDLCYEYAEKLIKDGRAYVCDLSAEEMREYRGTLTQPGRESPYRGRSVEENLDLLRRMRAGEFPDGARTLRAKIDMASPNMNLRDPAIYRIVHTPHHRQGDKWWHLALSTTTPPHPGRHGGRHHPPLCSIEFENHRPLYVGSSKHRFAHNPTSTSSPRP